MLDGFCFDSKNLYNQALYRVRQNYFAGKGYLNYNSVDAAFKADNGLNNNDYTAMPTAASAQQTLILLHRNWTSYFKANKAYKKDPGAFTGKPGIPKYLDKTKGREPVILPGQGLNVQYGCISFPKAFNGFTLKFRHIGSKVRQVRFIPGANSITAEVVYTIPDVNLLPDNGRCLGIDLGIGNFAALASNVMPPVIINGGKLKAINQLYNKQLSLTKAVETAIHPIVTSKGSTYCKQTNRLKTLTAKRNARVKDGLHKISRYIVDLAEAYDISEIVIGKNDGWKQQTNLGKKTNQQFTQLPHARFISMLRYKANEKGINVIPHEESYTSKTSHIDGEQPVKHAQYRGKRVKRGLFRSAQGILVNADINGAAQIMRKVFPTVTAYGIAGGVDPVKVTIA